MSIPVYPSILPSFTTQDYEFSNFNTIQVTQFKSGFSRFRVIAPNAPVIYKLTAKYTVQELALFEAWRHYALKNIGRFSVYLSTELGMQWRTVRLLKNDYTKKRLTPLYYQISLEVMEEKQSFMSEEHMEGFIQAGFFDFGDRAQAEVRKYNVY